MRREPLILKETSMMFFQQLNKSNWCKQVCGLSDSLVNRVLDLEMEMPGLIGSFKQRDSG